MKIQSNQAEQYGLESWEVTGKNSAYLFKSWIVSLSITGVNECMISFNTIEASIKGGEVYLSNKTSPKDILVLFNFIRNLCIEQGFTTVINIPSCEKRARVYKLFAQKVGYSVREVIQTNDDIVQYFT